MARTYTVHGHLPSALLKLDAFWTRTGLTKTEADKLAKEQRAAGGVATVVADEEDEMEDDDEDEDEVEEDEDEDDDEGEDEDEDEEEVSSGTSAHARKRKSPAELDRDIAQVLGKKYPLLHGPGLWHGRASETRKQIAKERSPKIGGAHHATRSDRGKSYRVSARVGGGTTNPVNLATVPKKSEALKIARDFMKKTPPKSEYDSVQILPLVRGDRDWNTESMRWHGITTNVPRPKWVRGPGVK